MCYRGLRAWAQEHNDHPLTGDGSLSWTACALLRIGTPYMVGLQLSHTIVSTVKLWSTSIILYT
eukprot:SAG11_NODE_14481_length_610_cov_1.491194_1_plen_63_part_01